MTFLRQNSEAKGQRIKGQTLSLGSAGLACFLLITTIASSAIAAGVNTSIGTPSACDYLASVMDQYHRAFYVYDDFLSAGNHFNQRGQMCNPGDEVSVPPMNENCNESPFSGTSCIKCEFKADKSNWGGWFFMNGAFLPNEKAPSLNWGDVPNAGYDLRGSTKMTFWARGKKGGEKVKFFCFGIGRQSFSGKAIKPSPDSSQQITTGFITLGKDWQQYSLDLHGLNLSQVLLGFAWQTKSTINGHQDITFYLDEIAYDKPRLNEPRLLTSYQTQGSDDDFDFVFKNTAFVYDNALSLLAFLGSGDLRHAKLIADALVYAQAHDRYYTDGRLRNAYMGGDLRDPPGYAGSGKKYSVRMPGWWDSRQNTWNEDRAAVGSYAGNMAWAMLALLSYYEVAGGDQYLASTARMGEWIEKNCRDKRGNGGYTAGFEGWEPSAEKLLYKSTEHNIDLFAIFRRLYLITGEPVWSERARHARRFVISMWDNQEGKFWTGTGDDGVTAFKEVIPVDAQTWSLLALREDNLGFKRGLDYVESQMSVGKGFDFNQDADGVWYEGTAQMAAAFHHSGNTEKSAQLISFLRSAQDISGGLPAADREVITTGFHLKDGTPWLYYKRLHVGATAWFALAEKSYNPFWMGGEIDQSLAALKAAPLVAGK
ncbi:MAG: hypothetical protein V2A34_15730 [Lentisphaerota bacterium]